MHWEVYFSLPKSPYEIEWTLTTLKIPPRCAVSVSEEQVHTHSCFRSAVGSLGLPVPGTAQTGVPVLSPGSSTSHLKLQQLENTRQ